MKADVLLGLQWGDEGKGKIVDVLTPGYDVIIRFQGGPNAGHSLEFNNIKHILHTIPSGVFHDRQINVIGNGVVIDPVIFEREVDSITRLGVKLQNRLLISRKAHLILPSHRILDAASEAAKGATKIGSTLKGIGPTYMDKTGRNGLRVGDILLPDFRDRYAVLKKKHIELLRLYDYSFNLDELEEQWFHGTAAIANFRVVDSEYEVNRFLNEGRSVLAEGAQGTMLDIDFGSYPYVTSSSTVSAAVCTGVGVAPARIGEVFGVLKAYCTRVGSGPFPTELENETGTLLRERGHEYGATTGRPRRCGWLDLVALNYAVMINGVTQLFMTKPDVMTGFDTVKVCTGYRKGSQVIHQLPYDLYEVTGGDYMEMPGWKGDLCGVRSADHIPPELEGYIKFIERETGVPVTLVSVGPDRSQVLTRKK